MISAVIGIGWGEADAEDIWRMYGHVCATFWTLVMEEPTAESIPNGEAWYNPETLLNKEATNDREAIFFLKERMDSLFGFLI